MMLGAMTSHSLWLRGTPLGAASVPEVQQMLKTSLAVTGAVRSAWRMRWRWGSGKAGGIVPSVLPPPSVDWERLEAGTRTTPAGTCSPQASTVFSAGCFSRSVQYMSAAACAWPGLPIRENVTAAAASVSDRMCSSSCSRYCTGTGVTTMPSRAQAR